MAVTTLPSSLPSSRGATAAASGAGCVERSTAAAKEPKRPRSCHGDETPAKRRRTEERDASSGPSPALMMSAAEKDGVNRLLVSLLPPGCSPHEVNPLPDSVVSVLQENGIRRFCGGGGTDGDVEEIEVDIYTLGDDALRAIRDGVGAYVEGRALPPLQNKKGVAGLSRPRSNSSRAAPKIIMPRSTETAFMRTPPRTTPISILPRASSISIPPRSAATSIPSMSMSACKAESHSIPLPAKTAINNSISLPAKTSISQNLHPAKTSHLFGSTESMSELLYAANKACEKVVARRREIEKLRAAARQEVELMVRTVEFNDPYIDYTDVFK